MRLLLILAPIGKCLENNFKRKCVALSQIYFTLMASGFFIGSHERLDSKSKYRTLQKSVKFDLIRQSHSFVYIQLDLLRLVTKQNKSCFQIRYVQRFSSHRIHGDANKIAG